jgi:hypothetical protein
VYECLQTGFGLIIRYIELLQNVSTSNCNAIANSHYLQFIAARTNSSVFCLHQSLHSSGFKRRTFPLLWDPELSPRLSYQLLTATAHNSWTAAVFKLILSLTNQLSPLHSTQLHCTALHCTNCPAYNIWTWTSQKTPLLCCCIHCCVRSHRRVLRRKRRFPASPLAHIRNLLPSNGRFFT